MAKFLFERITKSDDPSKSIIATADIIFADKIKVYYCKLIKGKDGNFVSFPSRKYQEKWYSHVRILDDQLSKDLTVAFQKAVGEEGGGGQSKPPSDDPDF